MNEYTNNQERRSREEKLTTRSTLRHICVTRKINPGKKERAWKIHWFIPSTVWICDYFNIISKDNVSRIKHKLILIRTVRAPHVSLFQAWFQKIHGSFQLGENFKWLKEINNTKPSVQIQKWKKIKFFCSCLMFVTEECRGISKNMSQK